MQKEKYNNPSELFEVPDLRAFIQEKEHGDKHSMRNIFRIGSQELNLLFDKKNMVKP